MIHFSSGCKKRFKRLEDEAKGAQISLLIETKNKEALQSLLDDKSKAEKDLMNQLEEQKAIVNYTLLEKEKLEKAWAALGKSPEEIHQEATDEQIELADRNMDIQHLRNEIERLKKVHEREVKSLCAQIKNMKKSKKDKS